MKILKPLFGFVAIAALLTGCTDNNGPEQITDDDDNIVEGKAQVMINEVCGAGAVSEDPAGEADWIEIYNGGTATASLGDAYVEKTDEDGIIETVYTMSSTCELAAGEYLVLSYPAELSAKISNKKPVAITLRDASGEIIDFFDRDADIEEGTGISDSFGNNKGHNPGGSYARIPNGGTEWKIVAQATPGAANQDNATDEDPDEGEADDNTSSGVKDYSGLVLNELNGNKPKYIEIYNKLDKEVDLEGVQLCKNDESPVIWIAPKMSIAAGGRIVLYSDQDTNNSSAGFKGGLSAKKAVKIELLDPDGNLLDVFKNLSSDYSETWDEVPLYNGDATGESYGRYPDATGSWYMMTPSEGEANTAGTTEISW